MPTADERPHRRLSRPSGLGDLLTKYGLPVIAIGLLVFAGWYVMGQQSVATNPPPPVEPARSPFPETLAASGVVEAQTENIAIGSATPGVVTKVFVTVGDDVTAGTPLFHLDDRQLLAQREVKRAAVHAAKNELIKLEAAPRKEEVPLRQAVVDQAQAVLDLARDALRRSQDTFAKKVSTEQDLITRQEAVLVAEAKLAQADADLALLEAGSWSYDVEVARSAVSQAEAELAQTETDLERLTVRALVDGEVLQVNVRPGEYVGTPPSEPLIVLGDVERLHVRVDIDEFDISRFHPDAAASAVPRGSLNDRYPLEFFRVEPYVVPKKSLTGDNSERVDIRVLQVIYTCNPAGLPQLYVGQQMEVFLDAATKKADPRAVDRSPAGSGAGDEAISPTTGGGT